MWKSVMTHFLSTKQPVVNLRFLWTVLGVRHLQTVVSLSTGLNCQKLSCRLDTKTAKRSLHWKGDILVYQTTSGVRSFGIWHIMQTTYILIGTTARVNGDFVSVSAITTCKIVSILCSLGIGLDILKNVIVIFFENQISKWRSFGKKGDFDLLFTFFSHQGKHTKIPSAHISLSIGPHIHIFCSSYCLFCLTIFA